MIKKITSKFVLFMLAMAFVFTISGVEAFADGPTRAEKDAKTAEIAARTSITIDNDFVNEYDTYVGTTNTKGVFCALRWALSDASAATQITINAAHYPEITDPSHRRIMIYSNKTLDLGGATLKRTGTENMIVTGNPDATAAGYAYSNITIKNGTISGGSKDAGLSRLARVDGLTLENVTFTSIGQHAAEFAAVKNVTINNCRFENPNYNVKSTKSGHEALSFDLTSNDEDFRDYAPADLLTCDGVKITNCTFSGVYRALGSHHFVDKKYFRGIQVSNCTFSDIPDTAIEACGWQNAVIANNTFDRVGFGVDTKQPPELIKATSKFTTYNANTIIDNNTFKIVKTASKTMRCGVRAGGFINDKNGKLKKGKYFINGYTITNNKISGSVTRGISVEYSKKCKVNGNTINGHKKETFFLLGFENCQNCTAKNNTMTTSKYYGIDCFGACKNITIDSCKVYKTKLSPVNVDKKCKKVKVKNLIKKK